MEQRHNDVVEPEKEDQKKIMNNTHKKGAMAIG